MSEKTGQFHAKDAFTYVDAYRGAIRKRAGILKDELEVKQKRLWDDEVKTTHFYAELRAMEDAYRHVLKGEEPDWVLLGDSEDVDETQCDPEELAAYQRKVGQLTDERLQLEAKYKQLQEHIQELQAGMIRQRQEIGALVRRLQQNNSTFMVVVATMFLVILVQLYLIWVH